MSSSTHPAARPRISVIVPTYNRWGSLTRLLEGLTRQTLSADEFEVVVVDDGSTDGTPLRLRALAGTLPFVVRLMEQPHRGPAEARNLGVRNACGDIVLFLDDDVDPAPPNVETHLEFHAVDPRRVIIGPMSPPGDWPRPAWVRWEEEKLEDQYRAMRTGMWACTPRQFYTANASVSRKLFLAAGGFDAGFNRAEDVELGYRLRDLGAEFVFTPRAVVRHFASRTFAAWSRTPYQYGRYDVLMYRDKGYETLPAASREFHRRNPWIRMLIRTCLGRPPLVRAAVLTLRGVARLCDRSRTRRVTMVALSGIFNLLYWQGVCDELGSVKLVWKSVAAGAPSSATA